MCRAPGHMCWQQLCIPAEAGRGQVEAGQERREGCECDVCGYGGSHAISSRSRVCRVSMCMCVHMDVEARVSLSGPSFRLCQDCFLRQGVSLGPGASQLG